MAPLPRVSTSSSIHQPLLSSPALTIRNLTTTPLELSLVEHFAHARSVDHGAAPATSFASFTGIARAISSLTSTITCPSSRELARKAESFSRQAVSVPIRPLEAKTTDIQRDADEDLRLTFEVQGQRYRLDALISSQRSIVLTPLSTDARFSFTAIYLPTSSHLTIFPSTKLESWMKNLKNETPLSAVSMPGTHNSPACHIALPSVRCQAVNVKDQLEHGVRFLDIRVQPECSGDPSKDGLLLVHSAFPISLTGNKYFRDLVNVIHSFLDANPSETVIISLKREGVGKSTDQQLSKILHDHYANDPSHWFTENRIPALGEVRKKIVIMRRFSLDYSLRGEHNNTGWCIDAESWPDNCADGMCSSGEIRVQDFYEVMKSENISKKIAFSKDQLERAAQCVFTIPADMTAAAAQSSRQPIFINFLTASNFWRVSCWPDRIAAKVNPSIVDFLCREHSESLAPSGPGGIEENKSIGDGNTGIVVCDWIGRNNNWDLVKCIVGINAKLEYKETFLTA